MNKSDRRLKTIESQQFKKPQNFHNHPHLNKKIDKQKSIKQSLKQSILKENKDFIDPDIIPQQKIHPRSTLEHVKKMQRRKSTNFPDKIQQRQLKHKNLQNSFKANKSIIFSQHKLTDDNNFSSKLNYIPNNLNNIPSNKKSFTSNIKQKQLNSKKNSFVGSTKKKHSKSVYNYTEIDDYKDIKKLYTKQSLTSNQRAYLNRSSFTQQPHQISTSSVTKRLTKSKSLLNKILNNSDIKKKTKNFKILADCLRTYMKEQLQSNKKVEPIQIIKLVQAFNKTQISKMSKPLQKLISQMIELIHQTVNQQQKRQNKKEKKQKIKLQNQWHGRQKDIRGKVQVKFQTPQRYNKYRKINNSSQLHKKLGQFNLEEQYNQNPNDISKTKKLSCDQYQNYDSITEQNYHSSLSKDVIEMERGLQQLQSQEKQLKKLINEVSNQKQKNPISQNTSHRKQQINKLKQILQRQTLILQKINTLKRSQKSDSSSDKSSLKYYPSFQT